MKVLVTGGAGFIGSNLAHALVGKNHEVRILDNLSNGNLHNLSQIMDNLNFSEGSITDTEKLNDAVSGCSLVFHEAAEISVADSLKNPKKTHEVNVVGTRNVLEACRKNDVGRVILASSAAVYGDEPTLPKTENSPLEPKSPYAESKVQNELDAREYFDDYGLKTVCLRYFNVYGPAQNPDSPYSGVVSKFLRCAHENQAPTIHGDGSQTRDFVFVEDAVTANLLAMEKDGIFGEVFNIASGVETSILCLWEQIAQLSGMKSNPEFAPRREGDILRSVASIKKAEDFLGFIPQYPIKEGLRKTMERIEDGN